MGRSTEFQGGAYGNFEPEPVDINLSDKVTDHPFYSQPPHLMFHEPSMPQSKTCMEPGCGRQLHEHRAQSIKPTQAGYDLIARGIDEAKTARRTGKEKEARESHEDDVAMKGPYGIGPHVMKGKGWTDHGPSSVSALKRHLVDDHDLDKGDLKYMDHLARSHARWHAEGGEDHTHE